MNLFFQKTGQGPPIVILHGLFGSSDNWISMARKLAATFTVYLVDQRNHGHSPHSETNTYQNMVDDLDELLKRLDLHRIHLVGHSMGGKTAMLYGAKHPEIINTLTIIDIAPDGYVNNTITTSRIPSNQDIINAMARIDLSMVGSRTEVDKILTVPIPDPVVRQFIMKNLHRNADNSFTWKINLKALLNALPGIMGPITEFISESFPVLFIKSEISAYLSEKHLTAVKSYFPKAKIFVIPGAGHWIHADQPELLLHALLEFCS